MKIELSQGGGVLGNRLPPISLNTEELEPAERAEVEDLVRHADFTSLPEQATVPSRSGSGGLHPPWYEITVEQEMSKHVVVRKADELSEPLTRLVHKLLELRRRRASSSRPT